MSSWDQARRILNPGELLNQVRSQTIQQLLNHVLDIVQQKGLAPWPPGPDYLQTLAEQLEVFVDANLFSDAIAEIKAGSHRSLDSQYAQQLLLTLESYSSLSYK